MIILFYFTRSVKMGCKSTKFCFAVDLVAIEAFGFISVHLQETIFTYFEIELKSVILRLTL